MMRIVNYVLSTPTIPAYILGVVSEHPLFDYPDPPGERVGGVEASVTNIHQSTTSLR